MKRAFHGFKICKKSLTVSAQLNIYTWTLEKKGPILIIHFSTPHALSSSNLLGGVGGLCVKDSFGAHYNCGGYHPLISCWCRLWGLVADEIGPYRLLTNGC